MTPSFVPRHAVSRAIFALAVSALGASCQTDSGGAGGQLMRLESAMAMTPTASHQPVISQLKFSACACRATGQGWRWNSAAMRRHSSAGPARK